MKKYKVIIEIENIDADDAFGARVELSRRIRKGDLKQSCVYILDGDVDFKVNVEEERKFVELHIKNNEHMICGKCGDIITGDTAYFSGVRCRTCRDKEVDKEVEISDTDYQECAMCGNEVTGVIYLGGYSGKPFKGICKACRDVIVEKCCVTNLKMKKLEKEE